jgi:hypothetical protein
MDEKTVKTLLLRLISAASEHDVREVIEERSNIKQRAKLEALRGLLWQF